MAVSASLIRKRLPYPNGAQPTEEEQQVQRRQQRLDRNNNNINVNNENENGEEILLSGRENAAREYSLLQQLLQELREVFFARPTTGIMSNQDNQRESAAGPFGRTAISARGRMSRETSSSSLRSPLPDIIQCHTGFSFDLSFESRTTTTPIFPSHPNAAGTRSSSSSAAAFVNHPATAVQSEELEEFRLEVKLDVCPFRQVGQSLREVADRFQAGFQLHSSTRRSTLPRSRSLEFRLGMSFCVPTIALLGIGCAFLRRYL